MSTSVRELIDRFVAEAETKTFEGAEKLIRPTVESDAETRRAILLEAVPSEEFRFTRSLLRRRGLITKLANTLFESNPPLSGSDIDDLFSRWCSGPVGPGITPIEGLIATCERAAARGPLTPIMLNGLARFREELLRDRIHATFRRPLLKRIILLLGERAKFAITAGETWSETALSDLAQLNAKLQDRWAALLGHAATATTAKPNAAWEKKAESLVNAIGADAVVQSLLRWFALVGRPRPRPVERNSAFVHDPEFVFDEANAEVLRGLAWCCAVIQSEEVCRTLHDVAQAASKKLPGIGPRCPKLANACMYALSKIPTPDAVAQLSRLKLHLQSRSALAELEKAMSAIAERIGMPREDLEELSVPAYGLTEVALRREVLEDVAVELRVERDGASLRWFDATGNPIKSAPAAARKTHASMFKELATAQKDISGALTAHRDRIERLFLARKNWDLSAWRERYLDHPLIGTLTRRLIWVFERDGQRRSGIFQDGKVIDSSGSPLVGVEDATRVSLWHPIDCDTPTVLAWRSFLDRFELTQPFKQAHREVYVLTDAERQTRLYSNRFAAHVLRQHQFNALCLARGWGYRLRLKFEDSGPPAAREIPAYNLRAEFWVEGLGDQPAVDFNETGTYLRVGTDQVRFYLGTERTPLPLDEVPPLVFSEIMRDVDLFVGVASVGNDPTWQDGGPDGRFRAYWHDYSFGELSANASTRRAVLESLLPRLSKIRDRCSLAERFLVVRGDLRTYKIHLGSGNILMEPNDQYLCIVPSRSTADGVADVFLPFEGDATLSVILSKAFLLAEDRKIKDPTITRQITP